MYAPPPFKPEETASLAFADARGFGLVRAAHGQDPVASWVLLYLSCAVYGPPLGLSCRPPQRTGKTSLAGKTSLGPSRRLLAITGGDAYVSADGYVSPDQLPSSPYQAGQPTGSVRKLSHDERALQLAARPDIGSQQIAGLMQQLRR